MKYRVLFFFRCRDAFGHSIEALFHTLIPKINDSEYLELPYATILISNMLKNIYFAYLNQSKINHITGDCHYIMMGLSKRNRNILTIHDCVILSRLSKWNPKFWFFKWFWFDLPIKKADTVTVISEKTKNEVLNYVNCPSDKLLVIPNYVNPNFKYSPKVFNKKQPVILQVGTNLNKNLPNLILAIKGVNCKLVIIGKLLKEQETMLSENKIFYSNFYNLTQKELINQYIEADIISFISTYEGFGMPVIESQAIGRALITSDVNPMKEIAGDGACLVDPYDYIAIKKAINNIISDDLYRELLISKGVENSKKYSFDKVTQMYRSLYLSKENL
jgi:glycosyltransferase involved in cell wall biosynthesis